MTDKFSAPFPITQQAERPVWRAKAVAIPILPIGYTGWYGQEGDFVDYDGFITIDANKMYHVAFIGESFFAELAPNRVALGRSAANVVMVDNLRANKSYVMTVDGYVAALQESPLARGLIRGEWAFKKKGANYRIELLRHVA